MKRDNDEVIAGKIPFTARERCYPSGVPAWVIFRRVAPPMLFFVQTPDKVLMIWRGDNQVRHVYLNVPHSANRETVLVRRIGRPLRERRYAGGRHHRTEHQKLRRQLSHSAHRAASCRRTLSPDRRRQDDRGDDPRRGSPAPSPRRGTRCSSSTGSKGRSRERARSSESSCAESGSLPHFDFGNYGASHVKDLVPVPKADRPDF